MNTCHILMSCTLLALIITTTTSCLYIIRHSSGSSDISMSSSSQRGSVNGSTNNNVVKIPEVESFSHRKLLFHGSCTNRDVSISQSRDTTTSSGIPQYIVQIVNTCVNSGCAPSNIHLHCGWFASARIVNPRAFKRLSYDDCLVNAGKPLMGSQIVRFAYSNSFMYPLSFKSANFC